MQEAYSLAIEMEKKRKSKFLDSNGSLKGGDLLCSKQVSNVYLLSGQKDLVPVQAISWKTYHSKHSAKSARPA